LGLRDVAATSDTGVSAAKIVMIRRYWVSDVQSIATHCAYVHDLLCQM
jgi:hypothetical protein